MTSTVRVRRVSRVLAVLSTIGVVGIPVLAALLWTMIHLDGLMATIPAATGVTPAETISGPARVIGFIGTMLPAAAVMIGLLYLRRLFNAYAAGEFFTTRNAARICGFAWSVIAMGLLRPVSGMLASVAVTLDNPPGQRSLAIGLGSPEVNILFVGGVVLVIGWVMREAARLADENAAFV